MMLHARRPLPTRHQRERQRTHAWTITGRSRPPVGDVDRWIARSSRSHLRRKRKSELFRQMERKVGRQLDAVKRAHHTQTAFVNTIRNDIRAHDKNPTVSKEERSKIIRKAFKNIASTAGLPWPDGPGGNPRYARRRAIAEMSAMLSLSLSPSGGLQVSPDAMRTIMSGAPLEGSANFLPPAVGTNTTALLQTLYERAAAERHIYFLDDVSQELATAYARNQHALQVAEREAAMEKLREKVMRGPTKFTLWARAGIGTLKLGLALSSSLLTMMSVIGATGVFGSYMITIHGGIVVTTAVLSGITISDDGKCSVAPKRMLTEMVDGVSKMAVQYVFGTFMREWMSTSLMNVNGGKYNPFPWMLRQAGATVSRVVSQVMVQLVNGQLVPYLRMKLIGSTLAEEHAEEMKRANVDTEAAWAEHIQKQRAAQYKELGMTTEEAEAASKPFVGMPPGLRMVFNGATTATDRAKQLYAHLKERNLLLPAIFIAGIAYPALLNLPGGETIHLVGRGMFDTGLWAATYPVFALLGGVTSEVGTGIRTLLVQRMFTDLMITCLHNTSYFETLQKSVATGSKDWAEYITKKIFNLGHRRRRGDKGPTARWEHWGKWHQEHSTLANVFFTVLNTFLNLLFSVGVATPLTQFALRTVPLDRMLQDSLYTTRSELEAREAQEVGMRARLEALHTFRSTGEGTPIPGHPRMKVYPAPSAPDGAADGAPDDSSRVYGFDTLGGFTAFMGAMGARMRLYEQQHRMHQVLHAGAGAETGAGGTTQQTLKEYLESQRPNDGWTGKYIVRDGKTIKQTWLDVYEDKEQVKTNLITEWANDPNTPPEVKGILKEQKELRGRMAAGENSIKNSALESLYTRIVSAYGWSPSLNPSDQEFTRASIALRNRDIQGATDIYLSIINGSLLRGAAALNLMPNGEWRRYVPRVGSIWPDARENLINEAADAWAEALDSHDRPAIKDAETAFLEVASASAADALWYMSDHRREAAQQHIAVFSGMVGRHSASMACTGDQLDYLKNVAHSLRDMAATGTESSEVFRQQFQMLNAVRDRALKWDVEGVREIDAKLLEQTERTRIALFDVGTYGKDQGGIRGKAIMNYRKAVMEVVSTRGLAFITATRSKVKVADAVRTVWAERNPGILNMDPSITATGPLDDSLVALEHMIIKGMFGGNPASFIPSLEAVIQGTLAEHDRNHNTWMNTARNRENAAVVAELQKMYDDKILMPNTSTKVKGYITAYMTGQATNFGWTFDDAPEVLLQTLKEVHATHKAQFAQASRNAGHFRDAVRSAPNPGPLYTTPDDAKTYNDRLRQWATSASAFLREQIDTLHGTSQHQPNRKANGKALYEEYIRMHVDGAEGTVPPGASGPRAFQPLHLLLDEVSRLSQVVTEFKDLTDATSREKEIYEKVHASPELLKVDEVETLLGKILAGTAGDGGETELANLVRGAITTRAASMQTLLYNINTIRHELGQDAIPINAVDNNHWDQGDLNALLRSWQASTAAKEEMDTILRTDIYTSVGTERDRVNGQRLRFNARCRKVQQGLGDDIPWIHGKPPLSVVGDVPGRPPLDKEALELSYLFVDYVARLKTVDNTTGSTAATKYFEQLARSIIVPSEMDVYLNLQKLRGSEVSPSSPVPEYVPFSGGTGEEKLERARYLVDLQRRIKILEHEQVFAAHREARETYTNIETTIAELGKLPRDNTVDYKIKEATLTGLYTEWDKLIKIAAAVSDQYAPDVDMDTLQGTKEIITGKLEGYLEQKNLPDNTFFQARRMLTEHTIAWARVDELGNFNQIPLDVVPLDVYNILQGIGGQVDGLDAFIQWDLKQVKRKADAKIQTIRHMEALYNDHDKDKLAQIEAAIGKAHESMKFDTYDNAHQANVDLDKMVRISESREHAYKRIIALRESKLSPDKVVTNEVNSLTSLGIQGPQEKYDKYLGEIKTYNENIDNHIDDINTGMPLQEAGAGAGVAAGGGGMAYTFRDTSGSRTAVNLKVQRPLVEVALKDLRNTINIEQQKYREAQIRKAKIIAPSSLEAVKGKGEDVRERQFDERLSMSREAFAAAQHEFLAATAGLRLLYAKAEDPENKAPGYHRTIRRMQLLWDALDVQKRIIDNPTNGINVDEVDVMDDDESVIVAESVCEGCDGDEEGFDSLRSRVSSPLEKWVHEMKARAASIDHASDSPAFKAIEAYLADVSAVVEATRGYTTGASLATTLGDRLPFYDLGDMTRALENLVNVDQFFGPGAGPKTTSETKYRAHLAYDAEDIPAKMSILSEFTDTLAGLKAVVATFTTPSGFNAAMEEAIRSTKAARDEVLALHAEIAMLMEQRGRSIDTYMALKHAGEAVSRGTDWSGATTGDDGDAPGRYHTQEMRSAGIKLLVFTADSLISATEKESFDAPLVLAIHQFHDEVEKAIYSSTVPIAPLLAQGAGLAGRAEAAAGPATGASPPNPYAVDAAVDRATRVASSQAVLRTIEVWKRIHPGESLEACKLLARGVMMKEIHDIVMSADGSADWRDVALVLSRYQQAAETSQRVIDLVVDAYEFLGDSGVLPVIGIRMPMLRYYMSWGDGRGLDEVLRHLQDVTIMSKVPPYMQHGEQSDDEQGDDEEQGPPPFMQPTGEFLGGPIPSQSRTQYYRTPETEEEWSTFQSYGLSILTGAESIVSIGRVYELLSKNGALQYTENYLLQSQAYSAETRANVHARAQAIIDHAVQMETYIHANASGSVGEDTAPPPPTPEMERDMRNIFHKFHRDIFNASSGNGVYNKLFNSFSINTAIGVTAMSAGLDVMSALGTMIKSRNKVKTSASDPSNSGSDPSGPPPMFTEDATGPMDDITPEQFEEFQELTNDPVGLATNYPDAVVAASTRVYRDSDVNVSIGGTRTVRIDTGVRMGVDGENEKFFVLPDSFGAATTGTTQGVTANAKAIEYFRANYPDHVPIPYSEVAKAKRIRTIINGNNNPANDYVSPDHFMSPPDMNAPPYNPSGTSGSGGNKSLSKADAAAHEVRKTLRREKNEINAGFTQYIKETRPELSETLAEYGNDLSKITSALTMATHHGFSAAKFETLAAVVEAGVGWFGPKSGAYKYTATAVVFSARLMARVQAYHTFKDLIAAGAMGATASRNMMSVMSRVGAYAKAHPIRSAGNVIAMLMPYMGMRGDNNRSELIANRKRQFEAANAQGAGVVPPLSQDELHTISMGKIMYGDYIPSEAGLTMALVLGDSFVSFIKGDAISYLDIAGPMLIPVLGHMAYNPLQTSRAYMDTFSWSGVATDVGMAAGAAAKVAARAMDAKNVVNWKLAAAGGVLALGTAGLTVYNIDSVMRGLLGADDKFIQDADKYWNEHAPGFLKSRMSDSAVKADPAVHAIVEEERKRWEEQATKMAKSFHGDLLRYRAEAASGYGGPLPTDATYDAFFRNAHVPEMIQRLVMVMDDYSYDTKTQQHNMKLFLDTEFNDRRVPLHKAFMSRQPSRFAF